MATSDLRRSKRIAHSGAVEVSWLEPGAEPRFAKGRCIDLSVDGLRMEFPVAIPPELPLMDPAIFEMT